METFIFLGSVAGFFAGVFITREVFSIPKITRHLEAHTKLLQKIAESKGVDAEEINAIIAAANNTVYTPLPKVEA